jgi:aromatic-L-amino-acid/L-tryptophan decarboxylase
VARYRKEAGRFQEESPQPKGEKMAEVLDIRDGPGLPLEPNEAELRELLTKASAFVERFVSGLDDAPVSWPDLDESIHREIRSTIGERGNNLESAMSVVERGLAEGFNTASPGFMAYIPGGGVISAAIADLVACATNRYVGMSPAAPGMVEIEWRVVRWLCDLFGYSTESRGVLTSGGSMANFSAVAAARHDKLGEDLRGARIYATDQTHHSVRKAARLAGFGSEAIRIVPRDDELRMRPDALIEAIAEDRRAGLRPSCVVANAGTTNTGAVDPIDAIADVADEQDLWLHVDGAYGGFFQLTKRGQTAFQGIERADSITLDPHKCMFLPYGTGAIVARDGEKLRRAHVETADYLQDLNLGEETIPNFGEYSAEFTRSFRGLRVWLPLMLHGVAAFREALDEKLDLAEHMHGALSETPGLELPWPPGLSVVPFRVVGEAEAANAATREVLDRVNASRRVFFSTTTIDGLLYIRPCIVIHRTHRDRIDEAIDLVREATAAVKAT